MGDRLKVCVIGAGVIGLSSAVRIQEKIPNVDITIMADKFSPYTCSDGSGGFWELFMMPEESLVHARKWCQETWDWLYRIVNSPDAGSFGAHLVSGYNFTDIHIPKDPIWKDIVFGYRRLSTSERKLHPENKDGVTYTTLMISVKKYLPWLMSQYRMKDGKVVWKKIQSLQEVAKDYDIVVNCSGIGANKLGDPLMTPIRGQVMRVKAPWIKHFYFDYDPSDKKKNKLYIFPGKDFVVLGGTSQAGDWSTDIYESDTKRILDGCSRLLPSLRNAEIIEQWADSRPYRPTIRLEKENMNVDGKTVTIVHNYGHAGSGITIHWGCAKDTADIVYETYRQKLNTKTMSKL